MSHTELPLMEVTLAAPYVIAGESVRARVVGEGPFRWRLGWRARGSQRKTDHREVVANGQGVATRSGTAVEATVPVGAPPSHVGIRVGVDWNFVIIPEGADEGFDTDFQVRAGLAPPRLDPWITRWQRQERGLQRSRAWATALYVVVGLGAFAAACLMAAGAFFQPLSMAIAIAGALALAGGGAFMSWRESAPGFFADRRARAHLQVTPSPAGLLGGMLEVAVKADPRRVAVAGGLGWTLRYVERSATRIFWLDRGQTRERYEWASHVVVTHEGAIGVSHDGAHRVCVPILADAPPTLSCDHRTIHWQVDVRCGDDVVEAVFYVAPFVADRSKGRPEWSLEPISS